MQVGSLFSGRKGVCIPYAERYEYNVFQGGSPLWEPLWEQFDVIYLVLVIPIDFRMSQRSERGSQYWFFGLIAVLLGGGDDFHMVPRMIFLWTMGLKDYTVALSLGEWITSFFRKVHSNPPSSKVVTYTLYSGRKSSIPALGKPTKKVNHRGVHQDI